MEVKAQVDPICHFTGFGACGRGLDIVPSWDNQNHKGHQGHEALNEHVFAYVRAPFVVSGTVAAGSAIRYK